MNKQLSIILIFLFFSVVFASEDAAFKQYSAQPDGANRVIVAWETKDESQLKYFIVQRSNDDKYFIDLENILVKGSGTQYEYIDDDVLFKSGGALFYKIVAVKKDGSKIETASMMVHPNISGIFRTWGAIKAMFR